jgi:predicted DNA-binding transcriptional regulator AlpA
VPANPPLRLHDSAEARTAAPAPPAPSGEAQVGRLIRQQELFQRLAISKATGHRLAAAGKIGPKPIRLGGCLRYDLDEVLTWLHSRRPDGTLHDTRSWATVWEALRGRKGGGR